jgi:hypothetical protein
MSEGLRDYRTIAEACVICTTVVAPVMRQKLARAIAIVICRVKLVLIKTRLFRKNRDCLLLDQKLRLNDLNQVGKN